MKKFKLAVVGLHFGKWLVENEILKGSGEPYFELAAVCDVDEPLAKACAAKFKVPFYTSLEALLAAEPAIPLILLATGPGGRAGIINRLIDAGKAVMTTKPFETDAAAALAALQKAEKANLPVFLNSPPPVPPQDIACILGWVKQYRLGRLVGYYAGNWASYREKPDGTWYDDPLLCPAAPLLRLGIYCLNDLSWFTTAGVSSLSVHQAQIFTGRPTADNACLSLSHEDGTVGSVYSSFCVNDGHPYSQLLQLHFENGSIQRSIACAGSPEEGCITASIHTPGQNGALYEAKTFPKQGAGYRWDCMHKALRGQRPKGQISAGQAVAAIYILQEMKRQIANGS
ncbi:MAG: Gfo/Idh/MocA family protein [Oscillospiraceae bacterium]